MQQDQTNYFDLHALAHGYLSRIRWVETKSKGRKAERFLACSMLAFRGDVAGELRFTYLDLKVTGEEAKQIVEGYIAAQEKGSAVFAQVRVGDLYVHEYEDGSNVERQLVKGRLLKVLFSEVHDRPRQQDMAKRFGTDLTVRGLGYLNSVIQPSRNTGKPVTLVTLSALKGVAGEVDYQAFDLAVETGCLIDVEMLKPHLGEGKTVLVGFTARNVWPDVFHYTRGKYAGQKNLVLKGSLGLLSHAKIDGVAVELPSKAEAPVAAAA